MLLISHANMSFYTTCRPILMEKGYGRSEAFYQMAWPSPRPCLRNLGRKNSSMNF